MASKISEISSETLFGQAQNCSLVNHDHVNSHLLLTLAKVELSQEYTCNCQMKLLSPYKIYKFDNSHLNFLRTAYKTFLPEIDALDIPQLYKRHNFAQCINMPQQKNLEVNHHLSPPLPQIEGSSQSPQPLITETTNMASDTGII